MISASTRRFEHGLPLIATLSPDVLLNAWGRVENKEPLGLVDLIKATGTPAAARTFRRLSAIWRAQDTELMRSETDKTVMDRLDAEAADRTFQEAFNDAMDFFIAAAGQLGVSLGSSEAPGTGGEVKPNPETPDGSPSGG